MHSSQIQIFFYSQLGIDFYAFSTSSHETSIVHCVAEYAGIEPRTVPVFVLAVRHSNQSARFHSQTLLRYRVRIRTPGMNPDPDLV